MKKALAFLLAMALCIGLAACGGGGASTEAPAAGSAPAESAAATGDSAAAPADGAKLPGMPAEGEEFTVAFLYNNFVDDGAWTAEQEKARLALEDAGIHTIYKENVPEAEDSVKVMNDFIAQGANVVIGGSFGYMDYMHKVAKENPDVMFLHLSGYMDEENLYNFMGRSYQTRFLSGLIAGTETKTNKLGYVAAYEIPEVVRQINAFTLGAQAVNPDVEVHVIWTHTWYDPAIEKEAGKTLVDMGCDVLTEHEAVPTSLEAAEEAGVMAIGYPSDIAGVLPKSNLTAITFDWAKYYVPTCEAIRDGTWEPHDVWDGLETGLVKLAPLSDKVSQESKDLVDEYTAQIIDGSFHVLQGPVYAQDGTLKIPEGSYATDEELMSMDYLVQGVVGDLNV